MNCPNDCELKPELSRLAAVAEQQANTLDRLTDSVVDHVKRTDLLEQRQAKFEGMYKVVTWGIPVLISLAALSTAIINVVGK
jgi:hypothetical protein